MNSSGHRTNILNEDFTGIGAGTARGAYSSNHAHYGCQVFSDASRWDFSKLVVNKSLEGGKTICYIAFVGSLEIRVIAVAGDGTVTELPVAKTGPAARFEKPSEGVHYACLYDRESDVLYPVKNL